MIEELGGEDSSFIGAFFVCNVAEDGSESRASKYYKDFVVVDDLLVEFEDKYPGEDFFVACIEDEGVLDYVKSVEQGETT